MLTVHHLQRSQSERIIWLCEELQIPYNLKLYQRNPLRSPPDLKALTPMGSAPVITEGSLTLGESGAIVEYIIHKHGDGRLALPPSHPDYAEYLFWFHFSNGNLQSTMSRSMTVSMSGLPPDSPVMKGVGLMLENTLRFLESRLSEKTWLAGDEFTAADIMSVFSFTTMRVFLQIDLSGYPNILRYLERVGERKAYKDAMEKGDPGFPPALGGPSPELFPAMKMPPAKM